MSSSIIVALISGGCTTLGVIITALTSGRASRKVMEVKLEEYHQELIKLEQKQDKHNNLIERMVVVEQSLKSVHKRVDELRAQIEK